MAHLSKKLATIVTDVPEIQKINIDELFLNINKKEMLKEFQRLEFYSILDEIKQGKYKVS